MDEKIRVVLVTVPDMSAAEKIGKKIVEERLAACVNIVKDVRSIYMWEGKLQDEAELLLIIKTRESAFNLLKEKIKSLHPYSVPEIISLEVKEGNEEYINWVIKETSQ